MNRTFFIRSIAWILSWCIVSFGQPSGLPLLCPIAASVGWAIAFIQLSAFPSKPKRFFAGTLFFFSVQAVQLFWLTSHPFNYIWGVWLALSLLVGIQFGILALCSTRKVLTSWHIFALPALWTLFEFSRLFWFSGFPFNPAGLALAWPLASLQIASIVGVIGMSFLVICINAFWARAWLQYQEGPSKSIWIAPLILSLTPYVIGAGIFLYRNAQKEAYDRTHQKLEVGIIHFNSYPDELQKRINKANNPMKEALSSWQAIIHAVGDKTHEKRHFDLLILPEMCIPFASSSPLFAANEIKWLFWQNFNNPIPEKNNPQYNELCRAGHTSFSSVSIAQALANTCKCAVIVGLEGTAHLPNQHKLSYFNSAFFLVPQQETNVVPEARYDKQILVPMGEYIPFDFVKSLAIEYGIFDSFSAGQSSKLFELGSHKISPSICYEELFENVMRKSKNMGATIFVNITDDYWYPNSRLAHQHFEHARPRTVENGIPLLRACNFGVSGAINSLGENVVISTGSEQVTLMSIDVSMYHYTPLYALVGPWPVLLASFSIMICAAISLTQVQCVVQKISSIY